MYNKITKHDSMPWSKKRRHCDLPSFFQKIGNKIKSKFAVVKAALKLKVDAEFAAKDADRENFSSARRFIEKCKMDLKELDSAISAIENMEKVRTSDPQELLEKTNRSSTI